MCVCVCRQVARIICIRKEPIWKISHVCVYVCVFIRVRQQGLVVTTLSSAQYPGKIRVGQVCEVI